MKSMKSYVSKHHFDLDGHHVDFSPAPHQPVGEGQPAMLACLVNDLEWHCPTALNGHRGHLGVQELAPDQKVNSPSHAEDPSFIASLRRASEELAGASQAIAAARALVSDLDECLQKLRTPKP